MLKRLDEGEIFQNDQDDCKDHLPYRTFHDDRSKFDIIVQKYLLGLEVIKTTDTGARMVPSAAHRAASVPYQA